MFLVNLCQGVKIQLKTLGYFEDNIYKEYVGWTFAMWVHSPIRKKKTSAGCTYLDGQNQ